MTAEVGPRIHGVVGADARAAFASFLGPVRAQVDAALAAWLDVRRSRFATLDPGTLPMFDALADLVRRGGKRQRAALVAVGFRAAGCDLAIECLPAMLAIELLQAYFLVHDDWMDGDQLRRGAPTVHVALTERFGASGDALAILAGDHANALAFEALLESPVPPGRVLEAAREFARLQEVVIAGQMLDVRGDLATGAAVEHMYRLKTASYTVKGPLLLGASLGGASPALARALGAFGDPLGVAFQLRDDLLGLVGEESVTGKPLGTDLRRGKRTALVVAMLEDPDGAALLAPVLGLAEASPAAVARVVEFAKSRGYIGLAESRIAALSADARRALEDDAVDGVTRIVLESAIVALGERAA